MNDQPHHPAVRQAAKGETEPQESWEQRLRQAEFRALERISTGGSLEEIVLGIIRDVEGACPGALPSLLLLDPGERYFAEAFAPNLPEAYNKAIQGVHIGPDVGSCGAAAWHKKQVVVSDIGTAPLWKDFREVALANGLHACWSTPILSREQQVLGTFAMYYQEPRTPSALDLDIIRHIVHLLALAIEHELNRQKLQASEERFRHAFQDASLGMALVSLEGRILTANPAYCSMLGYSLQELQQKTFSSITHPDDRSLSEEKFTQLITGAIPSFIVEKRYLDKEGETIWCRLSVSSEVDSDGRPRSLIAISEDITRQHRLESQLRQSQRLEALGQLTGGIAHDFNNLLTVILGNADLLRELSEPRSQHYQLCDMIAKAAERGSDLTRRLLAFARRQPLEPKTVDVNELIGDMDTLLARSLGEHITVRFLPDRQLWPATVDPSQLESAIINLSINARDAMEDGGRLLIETANAVLDEEDLAEFPDVSPGDYVMVAVSDTGHGIPSQHLHQVFEPFFTTKQNGKGTGLGLSMVFGFVKQSGGHISLYSETNAGTTVRLYLPRARQRAEKSASQTTAQHINGGAEHILLVEDDTLVRQYAEDQLRSLGYRVTTAENAAEAIQVLQSDVSLDLLFTDVMMPGGLSGRDLADTAAALRPALPVLFTSGYTENVIFHEGRIDAGIQLLNKPYRREALARKIRAALEAGRPSWT